MSGWLELLSLEALLFTISIAFILLAMAKERTEYRHRAAARTDPLTGIANRRGFLEQTAAGAALRGRQPSRPRCCCSISTISRRSTTTTVMRSATARCRYSPTSPRRISATAGTVGRWGGDEFVAVLTNTSREIAATVAERIQIALEKAAADIDGRLVGATVSTGMAFSQPGPFELPAMLLKADQALYRAKADGRNRLAIATPETFVADEPETESHNTVVKIGPRSAVA